MLNNSDTVDTMVYYVRRGLDEHEVINKTSIKMGLDLHGLNVTRQLYSRALIKALLLEIKYRYS